MRPNLKSFFWIVLGGLCLVGACYLILPGLLHPFIKGEPREPIVEIPVTGDIGWWTYQESLRVDSFKVEVVEGELNLFNNLSLIRYTIKGELLNDNHWRPSIKNIHLSQRLLTRPSVDSNPRPNTDKAERPEAIIEVTPVIEVTQDESYRGEEIEFKFTNEMKLQSLHWGTNLIRFVCMGNVHDLTIVQRK
ncbi:hypothetical protein [Lewinella sp. W8]|uniref:hypothetical protein n=1 Tax=Lewinella sp. W8 TaxID=2528208 RepID=UPI0010672788|nr:hypothetical protein [Lewinella sp. W8]MTB53872.1 hypothetical protein [Lewinella sp. W8]